MAKLVILIGLVLLAGCMQQAAAVPLIFALEGIVTQVDPVLAGTFNTAETFWGYYIFESDTPDSDPDPTRGVYGVSAGALLDFLAKVGSHTVTWDGAAGGAITVHNGPTNDRYQQNVSVSAVAGFNPQIFSITLQDNSQTALSSDALPSSVDLSMFADVKSWELVLFNPDDALSSADVRGELTSLKLVKEVPVMASVPEPSTTVVMLR